MSDPGASLTMWQPSAQQREVIDRYALGYRWYTSSRMLDIPDRTMANWLELDAFRAAGEQARAEMRANVEPRFNNLVHHAFDVLERIGDGAGELPPDHPLAEWAERILSKTVFQVVVVRAGGAVGDGAGRAVGGSGGSRQLGAGGNGARGGDR